MLKIIAPLWALFLGIGFLKLGVGLQGILLGVRAGIEGFPTTITGLVMSIYFVGFLAGSLATPKLVYRVGHVRVFAALASLASVAVLLHSVFVSPVAWSLFRLVTGFCFSGLYVTVESWLNNSATNDNRGQILSIYMVVQLAGMAGGQFLINLDGPEGFSLFILVSALVSLALIPILLSVVPAPSMTVTSPLGFRALLRASPLGWVGGLGSGAVNGALFGMGAVYAEKMGWPLHLVSLFMVVVILGGVLSQWPLGRLSDRMPRRVVITVVTTASALVAAIGALNQGMGSAGLLALAALFGALSLPLYSLAMAITNDHIKPEQMVAAGSSFVTVSGLGSIAGPVFSGAAMVFLGPGGFFWYLAAVNASIAAFSLYRAAVKPPLPVTEQSAYAPLPPRASPEAVRLLQDALPPEKAQSK